PGAPPELRLGVPPDRKAEGGGTSQPPGWARAQRAAPTTDNWGHLPAARLGESVRARPRGAGGMCQTGPSGAPADGASVRAPPPLQEGPRLGRRGEFRPDRLAGPVAVAHHTPVQAQALDDEHAVAPGAARAVRGARGRITGAAVDDLHAQG